MIDKAIDGAAAAVADIHDGASVMIGGFGTAVTVTRILPDGTKKVFTVDVDSVIKGKRDTKTDDSSLMLLPGDIVYVPERLI